MLLPCAQAAGAGLEGSSADLTRLCATFGADPFLTALAESLAKPPAAPGGAHPLVTGRRRAGFLGMRIWCPVSALTGRAQGSCPRPDHHLCRMKAPGVAILGEGRSRGGGGWGGGGMALRAAWQCSLACLDTDSWIATTRDRGLPANCKCTQLHVC